MSVVLDRQVRDELRATIDLARRERLERQKRWEAELREMARSRFAKNSAAYRARQKQQEVVPELELRLPTPETSPLIEGMITAPVEIVRCVHRGLRAPRLATGADTPLPDEFRCPDCRMILDAPL